MYYNLTHSQKGIWYTEMLYPGTSIDNIAGTLKINGEIDYKLLEKAILTFIEKNDALKFRFSEIDGEPYQYLSEEKYTSIDFLDFSQQDKNFLYEWDIKQTQKSFKLIDSCLFYFAILKMNENESGFYFKIHHLISDGWSIIHATNEIMRYYTLLENGESLEEEIKPSYIEFIEKEAEYETSLKFEKDREYWNTVFNSIPEITTLKTRTTSSVSTKAKRKTQIIPSKLSAKIQEYCNENKTSVFALFLSAIAIYVNRITGKNDLVIGIPVLNRANVREKDTIGMFISTVPLRISVEDNFNFRQFSDNVVRSWVAALKHHKYPYDLLLKGVREKYKSNDELYDIVLSYQNAKFVRSDFSYKHEGRWHFNGNQKQSLYIHINDREDEGNLIVDYDYLADVFYPKEIDFIQDHITRLLWHALDNPLKQISKIDMISELEKSKILYDFNKTEVVFDHEKIYSRLFEEQVKNSPDSIALVFGERTLTYSELNQKSNQLARALKSKGVGPDKIVGVIAKRSPEMILAIISVLKAGGAYLPIDPDYPEDRIQYMLEDSKTDILLDFNANKQNLKYFSNVIDISDKNIYQGDTADLVSVPGLDNLAYVIYTSGSTGVPKGVMLTNRGLLNLASGVSKIIGFDSVSTALSITTMSFDIFIFETLIPLVYGMKVVIANEDEQKIPLLISKLIKTNNVDLMQSTPSRMQMIVSDPETLVSLGMVKKIILGGEALPPALVEKLNMHTDAEIYNGYGPTETTVYSTFKCVYSSKDVNIGKPVANTQVYILDKYLNLMPIGAAGEIYIGGAGIGRGYINKPEMTTDRFVENPFCKSQKIYKTGDLARWYPAGEIEYLGRIDQQVKIRGLRIELGEIENMLLKHDCVNKVAVVVKQYDNDHKFLCGYFEGDSTVGSRQLRDFLMKSLPQYMIPSYFKYMDKLPLTPSGKVDRKRLPELDTSVIISREYVAPESDMEVQLAEMWQNILGIELISTNENFFEIGGDSLYAINLISRIYKVLNVEISISSLFQYPTIGELAQFLTDKRDKKYADIKKAEADDKYPLTSQQKRLFLLNQIEGDSTTYNMPFALVINGILDEEKLQNSFRTIIDKHETLRSCFEIVEGEPVQVIKPQVEFNIEKIDPGKAASDIENLAPGFVRPFDLKKGPLLRVGLVKVSENKHILLLDMHHIISDRASILIFIKEFVQLYGGQFLTQLQIQYKDYAVWQKKLFENEIFKKQEEYWLEQFEGDLPALDLPLDYARPVQQSFEGDKVKFEINARLTGDLKKLAHEKNATMYMIFLAAFNILLSKYSGQEDIIVGSPFSGRNNSQIEDLIGMFVNTIALRNKPEQAKTFSQFLSEVKENTLLALSNQDYPFEELVNKLKVHRDLSRNPIFDTMFIYNRNEATGIEKLGLDISTHIFNNGISKFDLSLQADDCGNNIELFFEYCTKLFKRPTIENLAEHLKILLQNIVRDPEAKISELDIMDENGYAQVVEGFNNTSVPYCTDKSLQELFEELVNQIPDEAALVFEGKKLTYRELNERANRLARAIALHGAGKDCITGIMVHRSFEMIIGILAILKAGGAYLPIDPDYPEDRVNYILDHCKPNVIITEDRLKHKVKSGTAIINVNDTLVNRLDASNLGIKNTAEDLGYVIYTSGTTGRPKGVMLKRKSLNNLITGVTGLVDFAQGKTIVSVTTFSFDIFIFESLIPLVKGLTVVIANEEQQRIPQMLNELILKNNVDMLQTTPSRMGILADSGFFDAALGKLSEIVLGGEVFTRALYNKLIKLTNARIYNGYGPTETTVYSTFKHVTSIDGLNIGKPIANTKVFILDDRLMPVPAGIIGELCIGGEGLGRGYLNDSEQTGKRFVKTNFSTGCEVYRTGDYARWLHNGELEYIGRKDHQVKIRGLRIELGEIENQLLKIEYVKNATVIDRDHNGRKYLCAYIETDFDIDPQELRGRLSKVLPVYMIPSYFVKLDKLPLSPNGKVDRKALSKYMETETEAREYTAPSNAVESQLVKIWAEVLNKQDVQISVKDNFFELGGDSLAVILAQTKLFKFNWGLTTQDFYKYQTIEQLSEQVAGNMKRAYEEACCTSTNTNNAECEFVVDLKKLPDATCKTHDVQNVLLTGVTGFLGMHILEELLKQQDKSVYCLIRGKNYDDCKARLKNLLDFYFDGNYKERIDKDIHIVCGNVAKEKLGIDQEQYCQVGSKIDAIVNTAALVKHYGDYGQFEEINVNGTKHVIEFAKEFGKTLYHISTMSVSGEMNSKGPEDKIRFTEKDFYIGQDYMSNVYVRSKFISEKLVFDAVNEGLDAYVLRMGNLTGRFSDGGFQINIDENAFYKRLKSLIVLGAVPESLMKLMLEFTPVDYAGKAVAALISGKNLSGRVYHLYNSNYYSLEAAVKEFYNLNIPVKIVSDSEFYDILTNALNDSEMQANLSGLVQDLQNRGGLDVEDKMQYSNRHTCAVLRKSGFVWPTIDSNYFNKIIRYMVDARYITEYLKL